MDRREADNKVDWGKRYRDAHSRDERENAAIQRMIEEEIKAREQQTREQPPPLPAQVPVAPAEPDQPPAAPAEKERPSPPRIGQDKRRFTFQL